MKTTEVVLIAIAVVLTLMVQIDQTNKLREEIKWMSHNVEQINNNIKEAMF